MNLIECVPNFSEGASKEVIDKITQEISSVEGVSLLDVDAGKDTNRTVVTFIGNPEAVIEAAFKSIKMASQLIDMTKHKGEHPRMGATDVCPLIPVSGVSMKDCISLSKKLARRVGEELLIPVYLYEESSDISYRTNLSDIRKGEYESLEDKLKEKEWKPDYGPLQINRRSGATAIGARNFLVAYNINLNTRDKKIASDIALDIREAGRAKRDRNGKILRKKDGSMIKVPGTLKSTKAVGWYIDEYNKAQVSMNLTNYKVTSIEAAFEEVRKQANKRGVRVTGSEIVGLVPKESLLNAGIYYLRKQKRSTAIPDTDIIDIAIDSLGLNEISEFNQDSSIVENRIISFDRLIDLKINTFSNEVSSESPAPGGGSVSALAGALSSSLVSMVANLSFGKKEYEKNIDLIEKIGIDGQKIKDNLLQLVDADTKAFDEIMRAFRMKKKTPEDIKSRKEQIQLATMHAINIPLSTMEYSLTALSLSKKIMKIGNKNSISDAGVAAELSAAAINGAYMNVLINLKDINNNEYRSKILKQTEKIIIRSKKELEVSRVFIYKNIK